MRRVHLALALSLAWPASAVAAESTEIASAFDEGNPFDLFLGLRYSFEARRAGIEREMSGPGAPSTTPKGAVPRVRDLVFSENKHTLTPHAEVGIFHDLQLSFALPIVLSLTRDYEFDQRADPCIYVGQGSEPTCINRLNSSTLLDGLLPNGSNGRIGYDARDPTTGFGLDSKEVFRSIGRSGLDQFNIAISWAPMNQDRDDTKPTWVLAAEFRISLGKIMRFNRLAPETETGVSRGVHEFRASTSVSKRTRWAEPFVTFWWMAPLGVRGDRPNDPNGSLFWDVGFGQRTNHPQQSAGTLFGFEAILYDKPQSDERLNLEVSGRLEAHFNGKGYSEMWEPFAYAGDVKDDASAPLAVDPDPVRTDDTPINHPGVTVIENYLSFGARVGLNAHIGAHARFGASFELGRDQTHAISYTDAGKELPTCKAGQSANCETFDDNIVTPGTVEVDPLHQQLIDIAGRRYLVDESTVFTVLVNGSIVF